jgi:hypothetical protein
MMIWTMASGCEIIGFEEPPDQEGRDEDQQHRKQEYFGRTHTSPMRYVIM